MRSSELTTWGRLCAGRYAVTDAALLATSGVLILDATELVSGPWVEIESGATLRGIRIMSGTDELTDVSSEACSLLVLVASPAVPYLVTLVNNDAGTPEKNRLWIPSMGMPGTFGNSTLSQHHIFVSWDPSIQRWRVPWSAT